VQNSRDLFQDISNSLKRGTGDAPGKTHFVNTVTKLPIKKEGGGILLAEVLTVNIPYILEFNPHPFYIFRGLNMQMRIRIECGLDSRSRAGFWPNDRASVCAVRPIQGGKNAVRIRFENIRYLLPHALVYA
jgi:hypothetical protein